MNLVLRKYQKNPFFSPLKYVDIERVKSVVYTPGLNLKVNVFLYQSHFVKLLSMQSSAIRLACSI